MNQDVRLTLHPHPHHPHPPAPEWGGPNRPPPPPHPPHPTSPSSSSTPLTESQPTSPPSASASASASASVSASAPPQPPPPVNPKIDFLAGTIGGAAGLIVGQPFDTIKVRWQVRGLGGSRGPGAGGVGGSGVGGGGGVGTGAGRGVGFGAGVGGAGGGGGGGGGAAGGGGVWTAIRGIVRDEGVKGLFKGVTSPMAGIAFINGVIFTSYSFLMKIDIPPHLPFGTLISADSDSGLDGVGNGNGAGAGVDDASIWRIGMAGAGSGFVASFFSCPTELIKVRQQSAPIHLNPSTVSVIRSVLRQEGVRGLYRGWGATAGRELAYGPYFMAYEGMCRFFKSLRKKEPTYRPTSPHLSALHDPHRHGEAAGTRTTQHNNNNASSTLSTSTSLKHLNDSELAALSVSEQRAYHQQQQQHQHQHQHYHHENLMEEAEAELQELSWGELMLAGGVAGMVSWTATFPLDVIKTRLQSIIPSSTNKNGIIPPKMSVAAAVRDVIRRDGWRGFWAGLSPTLLRAFPSNCVIFLTFEGIVAAFR